MKRIKTFLGFVFLLFVTIVLASCGNKNGGNTTDAKGITSIEKTGTNDNVDTYTITFTDGSTTTFTITNGINGQSGHTPVITIGANGNWFIDGVELKVHKVSKVQLVMVLIVLKKQLLLV